MKKIFKPVFYVASLLLISISLSYALPAEVEDRCPSLFHAEQYSKCELFTSSSGVPQYYDCRPWGEPGALVPNYLCWGTIF